MHVSKNKWLIVNHETTKLVLNILEGVIYFLFFMSLKLKANKQGSIVVKFIQTRGLKFVFKCSNRPVVQIHLIKEMNKRTASGKSP